MIRMPLALAAAGLFAACADSPERTPADTSARSPMTVNPPAGTPMPQTPPTLPQDPAQEDKSMPPGPVNPKR